MHPDFFFIFTAKRARVLSGKVQYQVPGSRSIAEIHSIVNVEQNQPHVKNIFCYTLQVLCIKSTINTPKCVPFQFLQRLFLLVLVLVLSET